MLEEKEYLRSLIEASLDPFVVINVNGEITDVNEATIKATGVSREELIGTDFSDYFTDPQKAREGYETVFREGTVKNYELIIKHTNGSLMYVLYNANVYRDRNGKIVGIFAAARDITYLKEEIKVLQGILPICSRCKKIRNDENYWEQIESYIRDHSEAEFSHGICPDCAKELYPESYNK
ncbi:MAG: PAS domain S-box protein [Spirochaetales bacterium]|jgi:PAS domain S-box-containing protein|nr:PAS domain S-box protein [Spirochaetales bacterium]